MKRVILDTNIYGKIIENEDTDFILNNIAKSGIIVYSCDAITKELRRVSKEKITISKGKKRKLRSLILGLYHSIVKKDLHLTEEILNIANLYHVIYRKLGGIIPKDSIITDFIIVNSIKKLNTPKFRKYGDFKNEIS